MTYSGCSSRESNPQHQGSHAHESNSFYSQQLLVNTGVCVCVCVCVCVRVCVCVPLLVVGEDVVHAEVGRQAPEGAVGRVHGTAAAAAAQGHRVADHRVHAGCAVGELKLLVVQVQIRARALVHTVERYLTDGVLEGSKHNAQVCVCVHF